MRKRFLTALVLTVCLVTVGLASFTALVRADTLNWHDPNGNGVLAASTESECEGFFTLTITYTIDNEAMENLYTIDWHTPPFRVTLVPPFGTRKTTCSSYKSCPEFTGTADWIDAPDTTAPSRGTQTFPAPAQKHGWVILEFIGDIFALLEETGDNPITEAVLYAVAINETEPLPLVSYTSRAVPLNPEDPIGSHWRYEYTLTNHGEEPYDFTVKVLDPPQTVFSGEALPGESAQLAFNSSRPYGVGPGAVFIETTGEIFPAASFVPVDGIVAPTVTGVIPSSGNQGETLDVIITGTNFDGATEVIFDAQITVNSFNVDSSTQITANIAIDQMCAHRPMTIFVTTPAGTATLEDGFTVQLQKGCFIATAAYGTPVAEEIEVLREFRDEYLLINPVGEALVDFYYQVSPPIAEFITEHPAFKPVVRAGLVPAIAMSTVAVNTTLAQKIAIVSSMVVFSTLLVYLAQKEKWQGRGKG